MVQPDAVRKVIQLSDGRDLAWLEIGDDRGFPILAFHGSPGLATDFAIYDSVARECRVRLIGVDRPGYGHSTHQPKRRLSDWPEDIRQLADKLDLERFGVIGHSAGGPSALACARHLPPRLVTCGVLSGVASQADAPMTEGMLPSNRAQTALYRHWPRSLDWIAGALWLFAIPLLTPLLARSRPNRERDMDRILQRMLPPCDLEVVFRPEVHAALVSEAIAFDVVTLRASVQDMAVCTRDWGFDVEEISVPVHIWHGDLDRNVPFAHAEFLTSQIPEAALHRCPGEGHWLLVDHMADVLRLTAGG